MVAGQILSARPEFPQVEGRIGGLRTCPEAVPARGMYSNGYSNPPAFPPEQPFHSPSAPLNRFDRAADGVYGIVASGTNNVAFLYPG